MSKLCTTTISLLLLASSALAAEHTQAEAEKAVTRIVENHINLYNAKNARGIAELFANDGVEVPLARIVTGRDNIEKWFQSLFSHGGGTDLRYDIKQVQPIGDYVLAVGLFTVKEPPRDGGEVREIHGSFVIVYEWDGDALKFRVRSYNIAPGAQP